jgi:hypothetical protein
MSTPTTTTTTIIGQVLTLKIFFGTTWELSRPWALLSKGIERSFVPLHLIGERHLEATSVPDPCRFGWIYPQVVMGVEDKIVCLLKSTLTCVCFSVIFSFVFLCLFLFLFLFLSLTPHHQSQLLVVTAIVFTYQVITPFMAPFGLAYFSLAYVV